MFKTDIHQEHKKPPNLNVLKTKQNLENRVGECIACGPTFGEQKQEKKETLSDRQFREIWTPIAERNLRNFQRDVARKQTRARSSRHCSRERVNCIATRDVFSDCKKKETIKMKYNHLLVKLDDVVGVATFRSSRNFWSNQTLKPCEKWIKIL